MHSSLRKKYIGNAAFYKMALAVAIPIMIQNGITNFVSLLDNIMVGRVGTEQMTGVAIVNQLIFVFNLAIFGAVSGAGIFGAQYYGKGDWDGVRQTFRFKLLVCTALTVLGACIFLLFGEDLILLYLKGDGSPEQIAASLGYAKEYLLIMLVGFIPFTLSQCYSGTLRETGQTVVPMVAGVVSVVVNLCFNTLLIFGYLGFPRLGASGAAIATVIARFVEAGVVMLWAHRNPERVPYLRGVYRSFHIPAALARAIARKSIPLLLNETLWAAGMACWRSATLCAAMMLSRPITSARPSRTCSMSPLWPWAMPSASSSASCSARGRWRKPSIQTVSSSHSPSASASCSAA